MLDEQFAREQTAEDAAENKSQGSGHGNPVQDEEEGEDN